MMNCLATDLPGVLLLEPMVFQDDRGWFMETYHKTRLAGLGIEAEFVQDNHSFSRRNVLRGLHYQHRRPQGKLIRVIRGEVFDVAVDLRRHSSTFGRWFGCHLSEANRRELYIPPGLAHGFCVMGDSAELLYKCTALYDPNDEQTLLWNDAALGIAWPVSQPHVSEKDARGLPLSKAPLFDLQ
jgi:dTDP-4-dehydrorhamnose 3,5-epimerase